MKDTDSSPIPYAELATAFVSTAREVIASTVGPGELVVASEVYEHSSSGLRPVDPQALTNWFWAEVEFSNAQLAGRFSFGDRESVLDVELAIPGEPTRYALWEWAQALGHQEHAREAELWIFQPERLVASIHSFGVALAQLYPFIVAADANVIAALGKYRADTAAEREEKIRARKQERDEMSAAEAFRREAYAEAAGLLAGHEAHLGPAQRQKLEMARRWSRREPS